MSSLAALRARLATVVPPTPVVEATIPTGLASLDALLPGGGIPRGRLTEIAGPAGSGATSLARALVAAALVDKRYTAYIDATRTLAPGDWAPLATTGRLWMVRPARAGHGPWCADILLRSTAFPLVVLDDDTPIPRPVLVRLTRLARETDAAFVVVHHRTGGQGLVGSAVRIELRPRPPAPPAPARWPVRLARALQGRALAACDALMPSFLHRTPHTITCAITRGSGRTGPLAVEVSCVHELPRRLCADPAIPDRRGVAPRNRLGERAPADAPGVRRGTTLPADPGRGAVLPRARRIATPDLRPDRFLLGDGPSDTKRSKAARP